jgi:hypothetical protein
MPKDRMTMWAFMVWSSIIRSFPIGNCAQRMEKEMGEDKLLSNEREYR